MSSTRTVFFFLGLLAATGLAAQDVASVTTRDQGVAGAVCFLEGEVLCMRGGRFRAQLEWADFAGNQGIGKSVKYNFESGFFWFFNRDNIEVVVKVLDGRTINGHFWVFFGSLTNVEFRLTVTDIFNGEERVYFNRLGEFASVGDVAAFASEPICGGIVDPPCPGNAFCEFAPGQCGAVDRRGLCVLRPEACTEIYEPVCGCDGVTYSNDCKRQMAGVAKEHDGACSG